MFVLAGRHQRVYTPLPVHNVLVLVNPWVQRQRNPEEGLSVLRQLASQLIKGLPLLPAAADQDLFGNIVIGWLPHEVGLLCSTGTEMHVAAV